MENATKALLIAAGVLIGIIILSMLLLGYNQISNYYQQESDNLSLRQIVELNKKITNYENAKKVLKEIKLEIPEVPDINEISKFSIKRDEKILKEIIKPKDDLIKELCPTADDLWLKIIGLQNGIDAVKVFPNSKEWFTIRSSQKKSLMKVNVGKNLNDVSIKNLVEYYKIKI